MITSCNLSKNRMVCRFCYACAPRLNLLPETDTHRAKKKRKRRVTLFIMQQLLSLSRQGIRSIDGNLVSRLSFSERPPCNNNRAIPIRNYSASEAHCHSRSPIVSRSRELRDFNAGFFAARINPRHLIVYAAIKGDPIWSRAPRINTRITLYS